VVIRPQGIFYSHVKVEDVPEIVSETILGNRIIERLLYVDPVSGEKIIHEDEVPFYKHQKRLILAKNGNLDPAEIDESFASGGYGALVDVLTALDTGAGDCQHQGNRGLPSRGGAGFSTGIKWQRCSENVKKAGAGYTS
jgi:NADH-quinone oxidoreductase subunit F